jgi:DNA-binding response OmpR family regulator
MSKHIAVSYQNVDMQKYLQNLLIERGYKVTTATLGTELLNKLSEVTVDIVISSYELDDIDGGTLYKEINKLYPNLYVILLGTIKDEATIVDLLKQAKCEVMMLPIVPVELLARIKALTEPLLSDDSDPDCFTIGDLSLDRKAKRAIRKDKNIILTPTEYRLLEYLMENAGTVLTREMILNKVWNTTEDVSDRIVDVYIGYLREKIDNGFKKKLISTSLGFGYTFNKSE